MKLCLIMGGAEEGGLENHVLTLCNNFVDQFDLSLIAHPMYRDRLDSRVNFIPLPMNLGRRNPWLLLRFLGKLRKLNPDLIHGHGNKAAAILASLKPWIKSPCIATVHNVKRRVDMFEAMEGVIGVSAGVVEGVNHARKKIIYNGVDIFDGQPIPKEVLINEWQLQPEKKLCVAVGRLVPAKAYDLLIPAWKDIEHNLAIVGEGPERKKLEKLINENNLGHKIKLVGFRSDILAILPSADLLTISSHREGFSLVLIETLLAETPVVSTKVAGSREILPQPYLCETEDMQTFTANVKSALEDEKSLLNAYQPVFAMAKTRLTTQAMLRETKNYYREIMEAAE